MNNKKLNELFLKHILKEKIVFIDSVDDYLIITDSYCIYKIKSDDFYLDKSIFKEVKLNHFLENEMNLEYQDSGIIKDKKYMIFKAPSGEEKTINKDLLIPFDLKNCTFKSTSEERELLYIYKNDELVGAVLPVINYYKKGDKRK